MRGDEGLEFRRKELHVGGFAKQPLPLPLCTSVTVLHVRLCPAAAAAAACGAPSALAPCRLRAGRACVARRVERLACLARLGRLGSAGLARLERLGSGRYFVPEHLLYAYVTDCADGLVSKAGMRATIRLLLENDYESNTPTS